MKLPIPNRDILPFLQRNGFPDPKIEVLFGSLELRRLRVAGCRPRHGGRAVAAHREDGALVFDRSIVLHAGDTLDLAPEKSPRGQGRV